MTGSFLSLLVIPMTILLLPKIELKKVLILITITWLAVALIQSYLDFNFAEEWVSISRYGYGGRGVGSLAPEPDLYGRIVLYLLLLWYILFLEKKINLKSFLLILALSYFQVLFLSKAATSSILLILVTIPLILSITSKRFLVIVTILSFSIFTLIVLMGTNFFAEFRIFNVIKSVYENPEYLLSPRWFYG